MFNIVIEGISAIFDTIIWIQFCETTMKNRKKNISTPAYLMGFFLADLLSIMLSHYFLASYSPLRLILSSSTQILYTFLLSYYYEISLQHRIFSALTFVVICGLSELIAGFTLHGYSVRFLHLDAEQFDMTAQFLSKFIQLFMISLLHIHFGKKQESYNIQYNIALLATPVISVIIMLNCPYPSQSDTFETLSTLIILAGIFSINIINYIREFPDSRT